jgi:hypothetical protein
LVPTRKGADFVVAAIAIYTTPKLVQGNEIHPLREDRFACLHASPPSRGADPAWPKRHPEFKSVMAHFNGKPMTENRLAQNKNSMTGQF